MIKVCSSKKATRKMPKFIENSQNFPLSGPIFLGFPRISTFPTRFVAKKPFAPRQSATRRGRLQRRFQTGIFHFLHPMVELLDDMAAGARHDDLNLRAFSVILARFANQVPNS